MKFFLNAAFILTLTGFGVYSMGCNATPAAQEQIDALHAEADAQRADGDETGAVATEAEARKVEGEDLRQQADTLAGAIAPFIPGGNAIYGLLAPFVPLLGKRGRKHAGKVVKALNPFQSANGDGKGSVEFAEATKSVARYLGMAHTSEATAKVSDEEDVA